MNSLSTRTLARILALGFALPGVAGFIPNPVIGPNGLFVTNTAHNLVHLVTAALFWIMSTRTETAARTFTQAFGVIYLLVGVLGFIVLSGSQEGMLLGLIHINQIDNFLHIGLGTVISVAGFILTRGEASTQNVVPGHG